MPEEAKTSPRLYWFKSAGHITVQCGDSTHRLHKMIQKLVTPLDPETRSCLGPCAGGSRKGKKAGGRDSLLCDHFDQELTVIHSANSMSESQSHSRT